MAKKEKTPKADEYLLTKAGKDKVTVQLLMTTRSGKVTAEMQTAGKPERAMVGGRVGWTVGAASFVASGARLVATTSTDYMVVIKATKG